MKLLALQRSGNFHTNYEMHIHALKKCTHVHVDIRMADLRQHRKRLYQLLRWSLVGER